MNDNEYREGESGFPGGPGNAENRNGNDNSNTQYPYGDRPDGTRYPYGQGPDGTRYPYGQNQGNTQYPYGQNQGNTQYPYGQNQGNTQYPYGQNQGNTSYPYGQRQAGAPYPYRNGQAGPSSPYGWQPYGYAPPRKPFGQKLREAFADPARRTLMLLGMATGAGILLYLLLADVFSVILTSNDALYRRYQDDEMFSLLTEAMYTIFCMAAPFTLIFGLLGRLKLSGTALSFGRPHGGWQSMLLLPAGLGVCFIGNVLSSLIVSWASSFGVTFYSYEYALEQQQEAPGSPLMMLLTVVHTAVLPALLEELVFRGFIMQPLRRYGDWFAIVTSALVFGLVHGNMTQAPFAVFAGLALGYINVVTGSMWMNILLHFLNNLISVLYSFAIASAGDSVAVLLSAAVNYGVIALGIAAFAGYALANRNFARLRPGDRPRFPRKAAHYWLMPTMLIALAALFLRIAKDIIIA